MVVHLISGMKVFEGRVETRLRLGRLWTHSRVVNAWNVLGKLVFIELHNCYFRLFKNLIYLTESVAHEKRR